MKKLLFALIIILVLSFCSCQKDSVDSTDRDDSVQSSSSSSSDESSATPTQDYSNSEKPIVNFIVAFDTKGMATDIPSQNVNENGHVNEPKAPEKPNFTFEGWYLNGVIWDFENNIVTSNIILEAKWTETHPILDFQEYEDKYEVIRVKDKSVTSIEIPSTFNGKPVSIISVRAFRDCKALTSLTIPCSIEFIDDYAFEGCTSLESIVLPNSVTRIKPTALYQCTALKSLTIGAGVVELLELGTLSSLNTIVVDESNSVYKMIGNDLYSKDGRTLIACLSAKDAISFVVPENVTKISFQAFGLCKGLESVTISKNVVEIGYAALSVSSIKSIVVDENNTVYKSIEGNLYSKDGTTLLTYAPASPITSFAISQNVTKIESYAFFDCDNIETLVVSSAIDKIPVDAIAFCDSLKTVEFSNGVTKISTRAIAYCSSLEKIVIPNSVTHIDNHAFLNCKGAVIYCDAPSKGDCWYENWNYENNVVVWK